uniref:Major facilitator superfamily (MFS) profile domain-containing protein n=1 Tax=Globodera rostochiensis TaxID=31243 RepID=A0A914H3P0_GLORO
MSEHLRPTDDGRPSKGGPLEGMDPVTGDYIKPQQQQQKPYVDCFTIEVPMPTDGSKLEGGNNSNQSADGSNEKRDLQRKWSRRIVRTLSNRSRDADDEGEWEEDGADNCLFGHRIRFTIMAISTLCLASILSNILTFNFTYICMAGDKPANFSNMTDPFEWTSIGYNPDLDYSSAARSALFMAVAVGSLMTVFPLTIMLNHFGSRLIFGCLGFISALATLLLPLAAGLGFPFMLLMRLIQGASFSACLPVMGSITSHWSTLKQNGIFIAILSSFLQIAPIFTMPISGELCTSSLGWPSVYYLHGIVALILFTIFMLYHRNSPHKHPMMSRTEIVKVMFNKGGSIYSGPTTDNKKPKEKKSRKVPYWAMYSDKSIWAILLSLQFMPTYINKVLHMPIEQTGLASAISPAIMFAIKLFAGQSSDRIKFISDERKLRIYNTLSMGAMGTLFIVLALLNPSKSPNLCLVILIASTCILGFNSD